MSGLGPAQTKRSRKDCCAEIGPTTFWAKFGPAQIIIIFRLRFPKYPKKYFVSFLLVSGL
jgi:hypothetical protein